MFNYYIFNVFVMKKIGAVDRNICVDDCIYVHNFVVNSTRYKFYNFYALITAILIGLFPYL